MGLKRFDTIRSFKHKLHRTRSRSKPTTSDVPMAANMNENMTVNMGEFMAAKVNEDTDKCMAAHISSNINSKITSNTNSSVLSSLFDKDISLNTVTPTSAISPIPILKPPPSFSSIFDSVSVIGSPSLSQQTKSRKRDKLKSLFNYYFHPSSVPAVIDSITLVDTGDSDKLVISEVSETVHSLDPFLNPRIGSCMDYPSLKYQSGVVEGGSERVTLNDFVNEKGEEEKGMDTFEREEEGMDEREEKDGAFERDPFERGPFERDSFRKDTDDTFEREYKKEFKQYYNTHHKYVFGESKDNLEYKPKESDKEIIHKHQSQPRQTEDDSFHSRYDHSFTCPSPPKGFPKSQYGKWERSQMLRHTASKYDLQSLKSKRSQANPEIPGSIDHLNSSASSASFGSSVSSGTCSLSSDHPIHSTHPSLDPKHQFQIVANFSQFFKSVGSLFTVQPPKQEILPTNSDLIDLRSIPNELEESFQF